MAFASLQDLREQGAEHLSDRGVKGELDLHEKEARLSEKERELAAREEELEAEARLLRARHASLVSRMEGLEEPTRSDAASRLERLPGMAPPLSCREREKGVALRLQAIAARESALKRRDRLREVMAGGLSALSASLSSCERELTLMEEEARASNEEYEAAVRETAEREAAEREAARGGAAGSPAPKTGGIDLRAERDEGARERLLPRARLDCEVDLGTESNFYSGFAQNVSKGGLFVATFDLLPVGSEVDLGFTLPSGRSVDTRAVVRWVRDVDSLVPGIWPGMGLRFEGLPEDVEEEIERFVTEREPIFFPDA